MPFPLRPETRERLLRALGTTALPFAEAVVGQAGHPLGAAPEPDREDAVADHLLRLFAAVANGEAETEVAPLAANPVLLAALFQNADLLHQAGDPRADALGVLVLQAAHHPHPAG